MKTKLPTKVLYRENTLTAFELMKSIDVDEVNDFGYVYFNDTGRIFRWFCGDKCPMTEEVNRNDIEEIVFVTSSYKKLPPEGFRIK